MTDYKYEVIQATPTKVKVDVDGKTMPFGKLNAFRVGDPGVANEIRQKYGKQVTVTKINTRPIVDRKLHPNRITSPGMPWHTYDELGRITTKEKDNVLQDNKRDKRRENNSQTSGNQNE